MDNTRTAHEVPGFGIYEYHPDVYASTLALTVPALLARVLVEVADLDRGPSKARKLRKAELAAMVAEWDTAAQELAERVEPRGLVHGPTTADTPGTIAYSQQREAELADQPMPGSPTAVARQEEEVEPQFAAEIDIRVARELAGTTPDQGQQAAAKSLASVAYDHMVALVQCAGRLVRGKVVDTVLRTPDRSGAGRVCLVVQHEGHPTRRTLHRLADTKFEH